MSKVSALLQTSVCIIYLTALSADCSHHLTFNEASVWLFLCTELITYLPKAKSKQGINLLSGQDSTGTQSTHEEQAELAAVPREYISYLKPNLTIAMVDDFTKYTKTGIPPPVSIRTLTQSLA